MQHQPQACRASLEQTVPISAKTREGALRGFPASDEIKRKPCAGLSPLTLPLRLGLIPHSPVGATDGRNIENQTFAFGYDRPKRNAAHTLIGTVRGPGVLGVGCLLDMNDELKL